MPMIETTPRQETTVLTTSSPNLEGYSPPLASKPLTTYSMLSFSTPSSRFLQFMAKSPNSTVLTYSNLGSQFLTFRPYIPQHRCNPGRFQHQWLPWRRPGDWGLFSNPTPDYANIFDILSPLPILTTIISVFLPIQNPLS